MRNKMYIWSFYITRKWKKNWTRKIMWIFFGKKDIIVILNKVISCIINYSKFDLWFYFAGIFFFRFFNCLVYWLFKSNKIFFLFVELTLQQFFTFWLLFISIYWDQKFNLYFTFFIRYLNFYFNISSIVLISLWNWGFRA